jgi:dipeptidase
MKPILAVTVLVTFVVSTVAMPAPACTTIIVTKGASADGSMMVAHSDDDELGDQRIIFVPAQDHPPGARRQIYAEHYTYPRIVTDQRGPGYENPDPSKYHDTKPIGSIEQVAHTYAYFDGNYGMMNEHNLMIGECTNGAKHEPDYVTAEQARQTGKHQRIFYTQELSRIALERCTSARQAIELMGALIDGYGYYSTGETLLVADPDEAWVFEMCALPDEQYHSAWVAQIVPDGQVFVAANEFRIRKVKQDDPDSFLYSKMLYPGVEKVGWWSPTDGPLDWLPAVSDGEYSHPYYSLRRVWRVLDRVNPDLYLSPWVDNGYTKDYPFSVAPAQKLTVQDVFALYRDHYEGTEFDLTRGVAAGPYGDPHRFVGPYDGAQNDVSDTSNLGGAWERAISVFYQGYTFVAQARQQAPEATRGILWFGPDVSYTTCFVPFFAHVAELPRAYQIGSPQVFDRAAAWWAFDFVGNWARLNFQQMTRRDITPLQQEIEARLISELPALDQEVAVFDWDDPLQRREAVALITLWSANNANDVVGQWWALADSLIAKYSDGYINLTPEEQINPEHQGPVEIGYPQEWLGVTNYRNGPTSYSVNP